MIFKPLTLDDLKQAIDDSSKRCLISYVTANNSYVNRVCFYYNYLTEDFRIETQISGKYKSKLFRFSAAALEYYNHMRKVASGG